MFYGCSNSLKMKIKNQYKNIKKRININTNDYKEYSEKHSSIEIKIKPVNKKFGRFINNEKEEIYYHIYFNNKEEIKRKMNKIK